MVNYPMNPFPFIPHGMTIDPGPTDRLVRSGVVVHPISPLNHDYLAIAESNRFVPIQQCEEMRNTIEGLLHESEIHPIETIDHPLNIGMFAFVDSFARDQAVGTTFELDDEETIISFVPHDAAINMRLTTFGPALWLMYIGFPDDYKTLHYLQKLVEGYGRLITWYHPVEDRWIVIARVRVIHKTLITKSFVVHQLGGACFSWTISVTILCSVDWNARIPEVPPAGEDRSLCSGGEYVMLPFSTHFDVLWL